MKDLLSHSIQMIVRNIKSYFLLSITIIISFSVLLGYLVYVDSKTYNEYKEILSMDPKISMTYEYDTKSIQSLIKMIDNGVEDAYYYTSSSSPVRFQAYHNISAEVTFIPNISIPFYTETNIFTNEAEYNGVKEVKILDGKDFSELKKDEIIISQSLYEIFGCKDLPFELDLPIVFEDSTEIKKYYKVNVVGVCSNTKGYLDEYKLNEQGYYVGYGSIYASNELIAQENMELYNQKVHIFIYSNEGIKIDKYISQLNLPSHNVESSIEYAKQEILLHNQTKLLVISVLLVVLGINMFGSLENVITKREYEIGIKRAIGASMKEIMLQFFFESIILLLIDTIISIFIISCIAIIYKLYMALVLDQLWIFYLTKYSLGMFVISTVSITVLYSFILSYKATKVEIISQLKSE